MALAIDNCENCSVRCKMIECKYCLLRIYCSKECASSNDHDLVCQTEPYNAKAKLVIKQKEEEDGVKGIVVYLSDKHEVCTMDVVTFHEDILQENQNKENTTIRTERKSVWQSAGGTWYIVQYHEIMQADIDPYAIETNTPKGIGLNSQYVVYIINESKTNEEYGEPWEYQVYSELTPIEKQEKAEVSKLKKIFEKKCAVPGCLKFGCYRKCGNCKRKRYCNIECLDRHWPVHQKICTKK